MLVCFLSLCVSLHFCLPLYRPHLYLHSFPTRRSSDLSESRGEILTDIADLDDSLKEDFNRQRERYYHAESLRNFARDRKSTRLNSSHVAISYAVFCLKKNKNEIHESIHCGQKNEK